MPAQKRPGVVVPVGEGVAVPVAVPDLVGVPVPVGDVEGGGGGPSLSLGALAADLVPLAQGKPPTRQGGIQARIAQG